MRILVLGGTGGIGPLLVNALLEARNADSEAIHSLVIYARSPDKLPSEIAIHSRVTVVKGELTDEAALKSALQDNGGVHAVVSCLGPPVQLTSGFTYPSTKPLAKAYDLLIKLMREANVKRLIALGTASIKDENDKFDLVFWGLVHGVATFAHPAYIDVVAIGKIIRNQPPGELVWTLVRVPVLKTSMSTEYVAGYVGDKKTKAYLSRNAYAAFVVDELENNDWANKAPLLSSP